MVGLDLELNLYVTKFLNTQVYTAGVCVTGDASRDGSATRSAVRADVL
jgi:hypothetical protein